MQRETTIKLSWPPSRNKNSVKYGIKIMEEYKQDREKQRKLSRVAGIGLTLVLHAAALSCACFAGMTYLDPPPPEREEILIDFDEPEVDIRKPERRWSRTNLKSPEPDRTRPDEIVKM